MSSLNRLKSFCVELEKKKVPLPRTKCEVENLFQLNDEAVAAKEAMTHVVEEENARIAKLAEEENKRLLLGLIKREANIECPICLEDIPPILPFKMRHKKPHRFICCGNFCCLECFFKLWESEQVNLTRRLTCPCCRGDAFLSSREQIISSLKTADCDPANAGKKWLLFNLAYSYHFGNVGFPKDFKKAIKFYRKSAEWGDVRSQSYLAELYRSGENGSINPSQSAARKWAEKAAEHGEALSLTVLASLIELDNPERSHDLDSLAAFQGDFYGRFHLGNTYWKRAKNAVDFDEWYEGGEGLVCRKQFLLSLYWFGKAAEVEGPDHKDTCTALYYVVKILHGVMMDKWHKRPFNSPLLPGYSDLSFCTWALRKAETGYPPTSELASQIFNVWNVHCAICGTKQSDKELKACARCKAFSYCSKECQVVHWKNGHKKDCKGHWIESFFPNIRKPLRVLPSEANIDLLETDDEYVHFV